MRRAASILTVLLLVLFAGVALAEKIPNWAAPSTWTPPAAGTTAKTGVKTGLVTVYPPLPFIPLTPCRLADTRSGSGFSGQWGPPSIAGGGTQRTFTITGQCGIPSGASAVSFNFAVWGPPTRGDLRVFPAGGGTPLVSTLNWEAGILALANAAVVPLGAGGAITLQVDGAGTVDIFFDVNGYYSQNLSNSSGGDLYVTSSGPYTIYANNSNVDGTAIEGWASGTGNSWGVYGTSQGIGYGVYGRNNATGVGVFGKGASGLGILGESTSTHAVKGLSHGGSGNGVWAESDTWDGLAAFGGRYGTYSQGASHGVIGVSAATTGLTYGLYGSSASTSNGSGGVYGMADATPTNPAYQVFGKAGVLGASTASTYGVVGVTNSGYGAKFISQDTLGTSVNSLVYLASSGWAGRFFGNVSVFAEGSQTGDLSIAGTLSKGGGSFKIDHPLDPENKYLYHSFVESPDMMNVYNGVIELGPDGSAVVKLPAYFEALNKDFRYQLTAIGMPQPRLHVALKMTNNEFVIAGGEPYAEVSWQVTGVRQDRWANANRIQVEVAKPEGEKGLYLHPELYGQGPEKNISTRLIEAEKAQVERALATSSQPATPRPTVSK